MTYDIDKPNGCTSILILLNVWATILILLTIFYWLHFCDVTFFWFLPTSMALSSHFLSQVHSLYSALIDQCSSGFLQTLLFFILHSPCVISSIPTLSITLYMHIPPIFISPALTAFLNYKSTCSDACWPSLLGGFTDTTNWTCINLNSSTSSLNLFISESSTAGCACQKSGNHS